MAHEMMNLFATPLYRGSLGRAFTPAELEFFRAQLQDSHQAISNLATVNKNVLAADDLKDIRQVLQQNLNGYFKEVFNTSNKVELRITQSWISATHKGGAHHEHTHPNSVASGVLYINLAENDGINFFRREENTWYELLREEETYYNAQRYFIPAKAGDILIFPSDLRHGVKEVATDVERVSLAFNSFFSGELGRREFSNALSIEVKS